LCLWKPTRESQADAGHPATMHLPTQRLIHIARRVAQTLPEGMHAGVLACVRFGRLPELREALRHKLATENKLEGVDVMVTAGANQAFMSLVLAMLDHESKAVLFAPYYFNHMMALQMTGAEVVVADCDDTFVPDMTKLEAILAPGDVSMVVVCNPCNPTGILTPKATLDKCAELCATYGASLVVDNTYDYFTFDGEVHECVAGHHVVNLFSFSKAFGMMGYRVGYIAYPAESELKGSLLKVQDTVPICANIFGQVVALNALKVLPIALAHLPTRIPLVRFA
jgi:aspartate/methionine/tyrosine aminotransferase